MKNAATLALVLPVVLAACGGNNPPPTASGSTGPDTSAAADAAAAPSEPVAPAPTASAAAPIASETAAPPAPAPKPPVSLSEPSDECTPVGVDFEKRARPKLKECYAEGKKKNPNLEGTAKIKVTVDVKGKIKSTTIVEKTLPDAVAQCMLKVIKTTPFPEVDKCWDATLTIPVTFPTPK